MSIQTLLRSQRNQCFHIIQKRGLNPADFEWIEQTDSGTISSKIVHSISGYY